MQNFYYATDKGIYHYDVSSSRHELVLNREFDSYSPDGRLRRRFCVDNGSIFYSDTGYQTWVTGKIEGHLSSRRTSGHAVVAGNLYFTNDDDSKWLCSIPTNQLEGGWNKELLSTADVILDEHRYGLDLMINASGIYHVTQEERHFSINRIDHTFFSDEMICRKQQVGNIKHPLFSHLSQTATRLYFIYSQATEDKSSSYSKHYQEWTYYQSVCYLDLISSQMHEVLKFRDYRLTDGGGRDNCIEAFDVGPKWFAISGREKDSPFTRVYTLEGELLFQVAIEARSLHFTNEILLINSWSRDSFIFNPQSMETKKLCNGSILGIQIV